MGKIIKICLESSLSLTLCSPWRNVAANSCLRSISFIRRIFNLSTSRFTDIGATYGRVMWCYTTRHEHRWLRQIWCIIPLALHAFFTYKDDSSSATFRFTSTFVPLIRAVDGFVPTLGGGYWQGSRSVMDTAVGGELWYRVSGWGEGERDYQQRYWGSEECCFYSLLEARCPLRHRHYLDWKYNKAHD